MKLLAESSRAIAGSSLSRVRVAKKRSIAHPPATNQGSPHPSCAL